MNQRQRTEIRQTQRLALNLGLASSIRVLRQDSSGLTLYLEEQSAQNPWLRLAPPPPGEWLPRWSRALATLRGQTYDIATTTGGAGPSLMAHVTTEIDRLIPPSLRPAAMIFAEALEPSGWLGRPLPDLARDARLSLPDAEALLHQLQRADPAGLFARTLAECLELQCREAGLLDATMAVVLGRLDLLASGDLARLARLGGVTDTDITLRQRQIRGLNPKPGAAFDPGSAPVREPDLVVSPSSAGWQVALNRSALPDVTLAPRGTTPLTDTDRSQRQAAQEVCRQVEARSSTLLRIASEILRRQEALITQGATALVPMTMADVAGALTLHISTVSRAVAGAAIDTPAGTFWLRHLFTAALKRDAEQDTGPAAGALRARLARLVTAEDKSAPLSDAALATALAEGSIAPARRTIAKYRATLSIPPAHRRRR